MGAPYSLYLLACVVAEAAWICGRLAEKPDITGRELLAELHERKVDVGYYGVCHSLDDAGLTFKGSLRAGE